MTALMTVLAMTLITASRTWWFPIVYGAGFIVIVLVIAIIVMHFSE